LSSVATNIQVSSSSRYCSSSLCSVHVSQVIKLTNVGEEPLTWALDCAGVKRLEDSTFKFVSPRGTPLTPPTPSPSSGPREGEIGYLKPGQSFEFTVQCKPGVCVTANICSYTSISCIRSLHLYVHTHTHYTHTLHTHTYTTTPHKHTHRTHIHVPHTLHTLPHTTNTPHTPHTHTTHTTHTYTPHTHNTYTQTTHIHAHAHTHTHSSHNT